MSKKVWKKTLDDNAAAALEYDEGRGGSRRETWERQIKTSWLIHLIRRSREFR
jgi:hypothetical protein